MADYYTKFSCVLDVLTAENLARATEIYSNEKDPELDMTFSEGFTLRTPAPKNDHGLWIYTQESGNVELVMGFVFRCAKEFNLKGLWGFEYSSTCSSPRLDGFGGGMILINLGDKSEIVESCTTATLLEQLRKKHTPQS